MQPSHPLFERALDYVRGHHLAAPGDRVLAAVSGGPDSVALLHILEELAPVLQWDLVGVAHFNHRLRGDASDGDQSFVEELAGRFRLPCHCGAGDVRGRAADRRISLEMAARELRHRFFADARRQCRADRIALGHTADDQAEELLLRLCRGTGPAGMAGMRPCTPEGLVRPLLFATRREILAYLEDRGLPYRVDASNLDPFCQRNALRNEVLPRLEARLHPAVVRTLGRHAELVQIEEHYWELEAAAHRTRVVVDEGAGCRVLSLPRLLSLHPALQRRLLRHVISELQGHLLRIYTRHIEALLHLAAVSASGKGLHLPGGLRAFKEGDHLTLTTAPSDLQPQPFEAVLDGPGTYELPTFILHLRMAPKPSHGFGSREAGPEGNDALESRESPERRQLPNRHEPVQRHEPPDRRSLPLVPAHPEAAWLDADQIRWPMRVRFWQPGDRFRPLGLGGSKKLQDFFTDARVPRSVRHRVPILCDREKICWVAGYRIDERVRITAETRRVLTIEVVDRSE